MAIAAAFRRAVGNESMPREDSERRFAARPLPHCKAILLCEEVTENPDSGAMSLRNLIEVFRLTGFPGETRPGRYDLVVLADDQELARQYFDAELSHG